jgi:hypothetical protein
MAVMREELVLVDSFTSVFQRFINLGSDAAAQSRAVENANITMLNSFQNTTSQLTGTFSDIARSSEVVPEAFAGISNSIDRLRGNTSFDYLIDELAGVGSSAGDMSIAVQSANDDLNRSIEDFIGHMMESYEGIAGQSEIVSSTYDEMLESIKLSTGQMSPSFDTLIEQFGLVNAAAYDVAGGVEDAMNDVDIIIAESVDGIVVHTQAVDSWVESVDGINDVSFRTRSSMQLFGMDAGRVNQQLTGVSTAANKLIGVLGGSVPVLSTVTGGMRTATGAARGLTAALGPIGLALGVISGVGSMIFAGISNSAKEAVDDVEDLERKITEFSGQGNNGLRDELSRQYQQLEQNNELIFRMNVLGGNSAFIDRIAAENRLLEDQIQMHKITADILDRQSAREAYEFAMNPVFTSRGGGEFSKLTLPEAINSRLDSYLLNYPSIENHANRFGVDHEYTIKKQYQIDEMAAEIANYIQQAQGVFSDLDHANMKPNELKLYEELSDAFERYRDIFGIQADVINQEIELANKIDDVNQAFNDMVNMTALSGFTNTFIDLNNVVDDLASAYGTLEAAQYALNNEQDIGLDTFYELMSISPQYLGLLVDEEGKLLDLEHATHILTQAKIDHMGVSYAYDLLNMAMTYQAEEGSMYGYADSVVTATDNMWEFVDSTIAAIQETERLLLVASGMSEVDAALQAEKNLSTLVGQVNAVQNWTASTQISVAERGVPARPQIDRIDNVRAVNEIGRIRNDITLADEDIRMLSELAVRDREIQINSRTLAPNVTVEVNNHNGTPLDENTIVNAVSSCLASQIAMHSDDTYL